MTLPAFAAERRAAAPLLVSAGAYYRWISHARGTLSSKPAARRCCCRSMGQTDGQTDRRTKSAVLSIGVVRIFIAGSCELTLSNLFCRLRREGPKIEV